MRYRRMMVHGASYFFTVNLLDRRSKLLIDEISKLKMAFTQVRDKHPFVIDAIVILPEHFHMIMTLPNEDFDYSMRLRQIKSQFSRGIQKTETISSSRHQKRERGIWQRRFWEHLIRNEKDFKEHLNYIHFNPVKHGYVKDPIEWPFSSIHRHTR